ncbi:MAG: hypothetical protein IK100_03555 [Muribaculaceae bacterium]|nr:hypothetical protein [Muribaculaceae bacterium]MBR5171435.1 hypothetical protein [Muribaculaceae bacterium]
MKKTDNINSCVLGNSEFVNVRRLVNTTFNVFGIMFFVTFLGYIAMHCF